MRGPLGRTGTPVAGPDIDPADWLSALPAERRPLVLAPSSARGWFGGTEVVAFDAETDDMLSAGIGVDEVGTHAAAAMASHEPVLAAARIDYEGAAQVVTYRGGLVRTADGWAPWGTCDPASLEGPDRVSPLPGDAPLAGDVTGDMDRAAFEAGVEATREAIGRGDVYVMNLTYRLAGTATVEPPVAFPRSWRAAARACPRHW